MSSLIKDVYLVKAETRYCFMLFDGQTPLADMMAAVGNENGNVQIQQISVGQGLFTADAERFLESAKRGVWLALESAPLPFMRMDGTPANDAGRRVAHRVASNGVILGAENALDG